MSNYNLTLNETINFLDILETTQAELSIINAVINTLNKIGIPTVYIGDMKSFDVQRTGIFGVLSMDSVEVSGYTISQQNTISAYTFMLRAYYLQSTTFASFDNVIKQEFLPALLNVNLTYGKEIIGYQLNSTYKPMIRERGAYIAHYTFTVQVLY